MWPRSHCYLEINLKERLSILISNLLIEITVGGEKKNCPDNTMFKYKPVSQNSRKEL